MHISKKQLRVAALMASAVSAGLFATPPAALAATPQTANLTVTATVQGFCTVKDGTLAFGTFSATGNQGATTVTNVNGSSLNVQAMCNTGTTGTITADMGGHSANGVRQMLGGAGGTNLLSYKLYTDSARTTELLPTTTTFTILGAGTSQDVTIYGQIPGGSNIDNAPSGNYTDTVLLTIAYAL